jgi:N-ethylmaleimide reductase
MNSALFQPFRLHDLTLPNRIVLAPLIRCRAGAARLPNRMMAEYYAQRSSAGLLIAEATSISEEANGASGSPGIYSDEMVQGWEATVDAVHERGGVILLQLWHAGRASHSSFHDGKPAVAPSAIKISKTYSLTLTGYQAAEPYIHTPAGDQPYEIPRALETSEIPRIVEDYRRAAERAKQAGFDGVEIHGANGYLIDAFLQSKTNHRTDEYGGSIENRYRFLKQVIEGIMAVWPANRIGVRLSPNGMFNDMGSPDYREQFTFVAGQLDRFGLAYLHVMDGLAVGFHNLGEPMTLAEFRKVLNGPLMGNSGYTKDTAEKTIAEGHADLISFGRPYISNPDLVERFRNGWPLAESDPMYWYSPTGERGYMDFRDYEA